MTKNLALLTRIGCVALLGVLAFEAKPAFSQESSISKLPTVIKECESKSGSYTCLTWRLKGEAYEMTSTGGDIEEIAVRHSKNNAYQFTFTREAASKDGDAMRVEYTGELHNGMIENGSAVWTYKGIQNYGTWNGSYSYNAADAAQQNAAHATGN